MIMSNKIYKITNGKNITLYANSVDEMFLFALNDITRKFIISKSNGLKCSQTNETFAYHYVQKLNDEHISVAFDDNMSILNEK